MQNDRPLHNNLICPICGQLIGCGVDCMKHRAIIHDKHCKECEDFQPVLWLCSYLIKKQKRARR